MTKVVVGNVFKVSNAPRFTPQFIDHLSKYSSLKSVVLQSNKQTNNISC